MAKTLFFILVMTATTSLAKRCDKCIQGRSFGMKSANCSNISLVDVPQCLRDDVEILDLSQNRLRTIASGTFSLYTSLKGLYLQDNFIMEIEQNAFSELRNLEVLDLSLNGIKTLPPVIFHLPSLRRLYLGNNKNINIAESVDFAKPITAPLEYLDLSFNEIQELPNLGILPALASYNISGNDFMDMSPNNFAGLCKLTYLYNNNFTTEFIDVCDCFILTDWFSARKVKLAKEIICKANDECGTVKLSDDDADLFGQCKSEQKSLYNTRRFINYGLPILCSILLIAIIALYCYCKRCKRQKEEHLHNCASTSNAQPLVQNSYS